MKQKVKTAPDQLLNSPTHQQALSAGDDHLRSWQFDVIDEFKDLSKEEIQSKMKERAFPYAVCFENVIYDFNLASGFRNANVFDAEAVYYVGNKKFDRRGMCGVHNYTDIYWLSTMDDFVELSKKYKIVGADNVEGAIDISHCTWEPNTLVVFGSESVGLTPTMQSLCSEFVKIPQFGSIRSLNVATASGIIMHSIVSQFTKF